ncbi:pimeloyl-ACP methyl ester carboxylesterase [Dokdonella fugitiva]|uniref:Pimeloyl-ACP methyl ester carboxylesterase n=1 Tax=Dokdonella fugitiva TaxID=328517 RepID=A0A839F5Z2_9GAMM|nr:hypothetical protein [Dokdonella fugitiva]MBA8887644.1 pimeloyl-ACP methyl ester carboxylesterase [Dokdonella fugitiva]
MRRAAVALLLAACTAGAHAARSNAVVDDPAYAHPTRLVDVGGGRRLNLHCSGDGTPTVVFDAGLANWSQIWGLVQPVVARTTRACSYDRAGLGFSDAATRAGTSATSPTTCTACCTRRASRLRTCWSGIPTAA